VNELSAEFPSHTRSVADIVTLSIEKVSTVGCNSEIL
jgi:hypothetical protein